MWTLGVRCDIGFCTFNIINLCLFSDPRNHPWMVSFVYGPTNWNDKVVFLV